MPARRTARHRGRGRNPLRRTCDRIEAGLTLVLVLAMLVLSPWAGRLAAEAAFRDVTDDNAGQRREHHRVPAVLVATADGGPELVPARARWTAPHGVVRTGTVFVRADRGPGSTVEVWVDDGGRLTPSPSHRDPRAVAVVAAVLAVGAVAAVLAGVRRLVRRRLDRRRMIAWQTEWATVGPRWSGRR
ncbi:Rv1733c family protein [Jidongwangia harbinensis]|uniref:Rv1733c family protein n=1 Tax=Jidongwangia harbinensis TaxID=2878561 RepID=UPI001CD930C1|nr:hypothetical protein [Jidongwangia harbinensis]MCA2211487.1 hypothetical protein [Jidongwangia harbinensis]